MDFSNNISASTCLISVTSGWDSMSTAFSTRPSTASILASSSFQSALLAYFRRTLASTAKQRCLGYPPSSLSGARMSQNCRPFP
jgi:hypothetical protein